MRPDSRNHRERSSEEERLTAVNLPKRKAIDYFGGLLLFIEKTIAKDDNLVYITFCRFMTIATLAQLARARDL